jgi:replicative DNA helicase
VNVDPERAAKPIIPPNDFDAERAIIGACTYRVAGIAAVLDAGLEPGHFYRPENRRQFCELVDHWIAGRLPDPGLIKTGITGPAYTVAAVSRPDLYADRIIDAWRRRQLYNEALGIDEPLIDWAAWWTMKAAAR